MARLQEDVDLEEEAEMRRMEQLGAQQGGGGGDAAPPAWVADALGDLAEDVDRDFNPLLAGGRAVRSAATLVVMLQQRARARRICRARAWTSRRSRGRRPRAA